VSPSSISQLIFNLPIKKNRRTPSSRIKTHSRHHTRVGCYMNARRNRFWCATSAACEAHLISGCNDERKILIGFLLPSFVAHAIKNYYYELKWKRVRYSRRQRVSHIIKLILMQFAKSFAGKWFLVIKINMKKI
jgi:hypothetical protein